MTRKDIGYRFVCALTIMATFLVAGRRGFTADESSFKPPSITPEMLDTLRTLPGSLSALPAVPVPADNPQDAAKIELGKKLFFDTRLSLDRASSCATCHDPGKAFADALPRAKGFQGQLGRRNSPTVLNAAYNTAQFWDGRAGTLDEQCKGPLLNPIEMNMLDEKHLVDRLNSIPGYRQDFKTVFSSTPTLDNVAHAIASFERTLVTPNSRFDHYAAGDKSALTQQEKRGLLVFIGKGACSECHNGPNFTDNKYYSLGSVAAPGAPQDTGRYEVTKREEDRYTYKTPSLRNVSLTAPYMHDGSVATLEQVVDFYDRGGDGGPNKSKLIYKLNLTTEEKADLIAFLKSLNGDLPTVKAPTMYPEVIAQSSEQVTREKIAR
jgi:cytochrome c peroxidase